MTMAAKGKPVDWQRVRAAYEVGGPTASFRALGEKFGVSHTAVRKRCDREEWKQDLEPRIRVATAAKVSGTAAGGNPQKTAAAVDAEAGRRAEVITRHRGEWGAARDRIYTGLKAHRDAGALTDRKARLDAKAEAFLDLKVAKISAEALTLVQTGERRAWRLDDDAPAQGVGGSQRIELVWVDEAMNPGENDDQDA
jgi:hypothetical protein